MKKELFVSTKQKNKIYMYVDTLSNQIVGTFIGEDPLFVKRWLMTLCFDALEKSHFNVGALAVFIQRKVYVFDFETMSVSFFCDLKDLIDEAINSLQDQSHVIRIKDDIAVIKDKKN